MTSSGSASKTARLETRISLEQKELIERAAAYLGRSVSDFVIANVETAAKQVIEEYERLHLDREQSRVLVEALLSPKPPNKRLREAVARHRKQVTIR
ncbi:MAG: DUF1778 domain-containing protein [Pirellulaceae bacterium]|nr:DUF1778 domain-containing protein [Pirellulaceae bacterium]